MSALINELRRVFEAREFDASDAWCEAISDPVLTAAIVAEVPRARRKAGPFRGELNLNTLRMALRRLDGKGLRARRPAGQGNYWSFRLGSAAAPRPRSSNIM